MHSDPNFSGGLINLTFKPVEVAQRGTQNLSESFSHGMVTEVAFGDGSIDFGQIVTVTNRDLTSHAHMEPFHGMLLMRYTIVVL